MRRIMCLMAVLLILAMLASPALAATGTFVPSISYKDGTEIIEAKQDGKDVTGCVVVTSLKEAKEKTTDIYQEERDLLWNVYEQMKNGSMKLPLEEEYVVRELVDVSFMKSACVEVPHNHKQWLSQQDTTIEIKFDLGVKKDLELEVLTYLNGQWVKAKGVENNGDGTVTCVFEDICPVAFCVKVQTQPPQTGDVAGTNLVLWMVLLIASFCTIIVMLLGRRKFVR